MTTTPSTPTPSHSDAAADAGRTDPTAPADPAAPTAGEVAADAAAAPAVEDSAGGESSPDDEQQLQRELDEAMSGEDIDAMMERSAAEAAQVQRGDEGGRWWRWCGRWWWCEA